MSQTDRRSDMRRRIASNLAGVAVALALACGIAALAAGPGYRLGGWSFGTGIQIVRWAATLALGAIVLALAAAALAAWLGVRRTTAVALVALLLGAAVAGPPIYLYRQAMQLPRIHDISTDTENPPGYVTILPLRKDAANPTAYSAAVAAEQKLAYPDVVPVMLALPPAQALERAERVARSMGWEIVAVAPAELRIEATATTLLFGFKDDIVIRVAPDAGGSRVDIRSLSRVGQSDIGVNAKRVRSFARELQALGFRG